MSETTVSDSSCLIAFERIGRLELLPRLFFPILLPPEVQKEFGRTPSWATIQAPQNQPLVRSLKQLVDDGEAEAIALASETGFQIILDDRKARLIALNLGIKIIGAVGLLVRAKREGLLPSLKTALDDLQTANFHVSEALRNEALRLVGE
jgi:predicted nucleic acid-binding protein